MKHLFYLLLMVFTLPLQSQSVGVNYQALIRDAAGEPFANRTVNVFVDISTDGDVVYAEEFTGLTTDEYGLLQLVIGKGANQGIPFFLIDWSQGLYFLDLSIRSGDVGITLPRTQFRSVPYSLMAETIRDPLWERGGGNSAALLGNRVGIGTTIPSEQLTIRDEDNAGLRIRADEIGNAHIDLVTGRSENRDLTFRLESEESLFRIRASASLPIDNMPTALTLDGLGRLGLGGVRPQRSLDIWASGPASGRLRGTSARLEFEADNTTYEFLNNDGFLTLTRNPTGSSTDTPIFRIEESGRFRLQQELNMDDQRIVNVGDPEGPQQVVNRRYLEDFVEEQLESQSLFPEGLSSEANNLTFDGCANRCRTLVEGGFSNWGIPSLDQISQFAGGSVGDPTFIWTTTGTNTQHAWGFDKSQPGFDDPPTVEIRDFIGRYTMQLNTGGIRRAVRSERRGCRCVR